MNSDIKHLLKKAQDEIRKIQQPPTEGQIDYAKQTEARNILDQSVSFADNVLKRLVAHTVGKDVEDLFDEHIKTRGAILINDGEHKKYTLTLDLVGKKYMLDLKHFKDHKGVRERIIFLLNTVKVLYCPIKDHMKKWAKDNDTTYNNVLQIGLNTTLFLDKDSEKRIGVILTRVHK